MILAVIAYFLTFYLVMKIKNKHKQKEICFPLLKMTKTGITFFSYDEHKINIQNMKTMQIGDVLYLRTTEKLIIISNVKNVKIYEDFVQFTSCGQTKILFDCLDFFRYFAIDICSKQFNLSKIKQTAILDLMNNNFDIKSSALAQRYINIIKNILNIHIDNEKVIIKPNRFKFSFVVTYMVNNKIKRVNIRQTL